MYSCVTVRDLCSFNLIWICPKTGYNTPKWSSYFISSKLPLWRKYYISGQEQIVSLAYVHPITIKYQIDG